MNIESDGLEETVEGDVDECRDVRTVEMDGGGQGSGRSRVMAGDARKK